jgi:hypothetical protein
MPPPRQERRRRIAWVVAVLLFDIWFIGVHAGYVWWHRERIAEIARQGRP